MQKARFFDGDISIVIPCWNHAKELDKTLLALENQSLQPKEVVVVDDASSDDARSVADKYANRLNIKFHKLETNQGAPAARNKGASMVSGSYIMFLDADVALVPEALAKMHSVLETNPDFGFVYSNFKWDNKVIKSREFSLAALEKMNYIHTTALIRRDSLENFDESLKKFQDWDLWLTLGRKGIKGFWINQVLFSIKQRRQGISKWLPSFMHKIPWPILGWTPKEIERYREAEVVIRRKHGI